MKISKPTFNPIECKIVISVESNLFRKYFVNFNGLIKNSKSVPSNTEVIQTGSNTVDIKFPTDKSNVAKKTDGNTEYGLVAIDPKDINGINKTLNSFVNSAIRRELKIIEFIPLEGYPIENMQKEIRACVKAKRSICIIKNYDEYLNCSKNDYKFNQYLINYDDDEYIDASLLIYEGNIKELRKTYYSKLQYTEWI